MNKKKKKIVYTAAAAATGPEAFTILSCTVRKNRAITLNDNNPTRPNKPKVSPTGLYVGRRTYFIVLYTLYYITRRCGVDSTMR